jgi:hypothetical protein
MDATSPFVVLIVACFLEYSICAITPLTIIDVSSGRNWHILTSAISEFISVLAFACNSTVSTLEVINCNEKKGKKLGSGLSAYYLTLNHRDTYWMRIPQ